MKKLIFAIFLLASCGKASDPEPVACYSCVTRTYAYPNITEVSADQCGLTAQAASNFELNHSTIRKSMEGQVDGVVTTCTRN